MTLHSGHKEKQMVMPFFISVGKITEKKQDHPLNNSHGKKKFELYDLMDIYEWTCLNNTAPNHIIDTK